MLTVAYRKPTKNSSVDRTCPLAFGKAYTIGLINDTFSRLFVTLAILLSSHIISFDCMILKLWFSSSKDSIGQRVVYKSSNISLTTG